MSYSASIYPTVPMAAVGPEPGARLAAGVSSPVGISSGIAVQLPGHPAGFPQTPTPGTYGSGSIPRSMSQQQVYQTPLRGQTSQHPLPRQQQLKNEQQQQQHQPQQHQQQNTLPGGLVSTSPTGQVIAKQGAAIAVPQTPVEIADRHVNEFIERDSRYPDLDRIIQQSQLSDYQYGPADPGAFAPFLRTRISKIPDIIFEQYNKTECYTKMGLFPQLQRAWITVDNRLYFWNYLSGQDFLSFEDLQHTILSVQLIKPKKGTFIDSINYLLLLATPLEFHILAVSFTNNDLQLYDTGMVVSIKGLDVNAIAGSDATGRIFFTSRGSQDLWEITYSNTESWFRGKCGKVCHTKSGLSAFSPSMGSLSPIAKMAFPFSSSSVLSYILPSVQSETIAQIAVDDTRKLIYTLSSRSTLRAYHMSNPTDLTLVITYTYASISSHLQMINATSPLLDPRNTTIVSIHPVRPTESTQIHLIATTSTGCRLFLRAARTYGFGFASTESAPPTTMQVIQVRFPPRDAISQTSSTSTLLKSTRFSKIFVPGYFFAVKEGSTSDSLFVSAPDSCRILRQSLTSQSAPQFLENAVWADIEGFVQAIELITSEFQVSNRPEGFGNEISGQYILPPAEIAVLTNTGVHIYTRRYMAQTFLQCNNLRLFIELYGRGETCCASLSIAASSQWPLDARELARRAYIEHGGKAHVRDDNYGVVELSIDSIQLSGRFDGLGMYIARIVRPIWTTPIFKMAASVAKGQQVRSFSTNVSADKLSTYQVLLFELYDFLDQNRNYIDGLSGPDIVPGGFGTQRSDELALQAEHRGMYALLQLIITMREGISFVSMVAGEPKKLNEIMANLSAETQNRIAKLTFHDLFTKNEGTELAKDFVAAIVNQSIDAGGSVDSVVDILRKRCGSFCSADDVILFKAREYLHKAKSVAATDPDLKLQYLRESVRLLEKTAGTILFDDLQGAVRELLSLEFHPGAVEVVLKAAVEADRGNLSVGYFADGMPAMDPREELFNKRVRCYNLVFFILEDVDARAAETESSLQQQQQVLAPAGTTPAAAPLPTAELQKETYAVAFSSRDELFHYWFYDWYVSRGLANRLLEVDTPYIESYLERNSTTSIEQANLLWLFYAKKDQFYKAGQVLYRLSQSNFEIPLAQRIEFLSRARGFCNCYCPPGQRQAMLRLQQMIQDELTVAFIQDDVLGRIKTDERLANDETKRAELIDRLDGKVLNLSILYNEFANPLAYKDICEAIVKAADYNG
ncbi:Nup133 N terminal like-domain-containing protein [Lipomyces kononenkoae]|uniref:Nup133 N terminal like-domain-containing protein n=1 Tax=Lipomyces kononenkoae TaxID=34357 RepID=A0ACC3T043_LIPKO